MKAALYLAQTNPGATESTTSVSGTAAPTTNPVPPPWWANQFFPLILALCVLWFFMTRSKKGQERKRTDMLAQLKRGDRVQTIGGILGTVVEAREHDVVLKVDEGSNTKMRFTRSAIHKVLEEEKAESAKT